MRYLIVARLKRESLLESVCASHALGVNDQRLVKLKADVQRLDKLSRSLFLASNVAEDVNI